MLKESMEVETIDLNMRSSFCLKLGVLLPKVSFGQVCILKQFSDWC